MSDSNWSVRIAVVGCIAAVLIIVWGLSASIFAMGWSSGLQQAEANGYAAEYPADTYERIDECPSDPVTSLKQCVEEAVSASHEAQRAEYDLNAQRNMAEWAWWLLIVSTVGMGVTTIGTIFLAVQVQLTREAVKDTGEATKAMVRQNELTEAAQRPWLSIEAMVVECEISSEGTNIRFEAEVTNIGKMVAERCAVRTAFIEDDTCPSGLNMIDLTRKKTAIAAAGDMQEVRSPYPMLPQQSHRHGTKRETIGEPHWLDLDAYPDKRLLYTFFVSARYFVPGDDKIRETDRAFCLTYVPPGKSRDDAFLPVGIPHPLPDDFSIERVWLRPAGHNRTT